MTERKFTTNVLLASRPKAARQQKGGLQLGIGAAEGGANVERSRGCALGNG